MTNYVYCTATCSTNYVCYDVTPAQANAKVKKWPDGRKMMVTINGGHGVSNKHFVTPRGVVTQVSDEDMEWLQHDEAFKRHQKAGFIVVDRKKRNPEKVAAEMQDKDGSAPITPDDYETESDGTTKIFKKKNKGALL